MRSICARVGEMGPSVSRSVIVVLRKKHKFS
jgi:hypothetical protein